MSTPIISKELRQIVASVRRDKTTGYISLKHQEGGQRTQGLMQFVEGKLAYVSYGDAKNKDALERIKELTNPELSFGKGLSPIYLQTLDARDNKRATPASAPVAASQEGAQPSIGRSSREAGDTTMFQTAASESMSAPATASVATTPHASVAAAVESVPQASNSFTFEDHTGAASIAMNNAMSSAVSNVATATTQAATQVKNQVTPHVAAPNLSNMAAKVGDTVSNASQDAREAVQDWGQEATENVQDTLRNVRSNTVGAQARPTSGSADVNASTVSRLANVDQIPLMQRISTKIVGALLGLALASLLIFLALDYVNMRNSLQTDLADHAGDVVEQLTTHLAQPLWDLDQVIVNESIKAEMLDQRIAAVRVLDPSRNTAFASWGRDDAGQVVEIEQEPSNQEQNFIVEEREIFSPQTTSRNTATGRVKLWVDKTSVATDLRNFLLSELVRIGLLALLLILATYLFVRWLLINRVLRLTEAANAISTGKTDMTIDIHSSDELGLLADAIRRMQASLQFAMRRLRR